MQPEGCCVPGSLSRRTKSGLKVSIIDRDYATEHFGCRSTQAFWEEQYNGSCGLATLCRDGKTQEKDFGGLLLCNNDADIYSVWLLADSMPFPVVLVPKLDLRNLTSPGRTSSW